MASMEPRTHARGNIQLRAQYGESSGMLQWSHALTRVETGVDLRERIAQSRASMEPRTHARGNAKSRLRSGASSLRLQWSHALTRVETSLSNGDGVSGNPSFNGATHSRAWKQALGRINRVRVLRASMEPRTHARGNGSICAKRTIRSTASMEPRTHARGNFGTWPFVAL